MLLGVALESLVQLFLDMGSFMVEALANILLIGFSMESRHMISLSWIQPGKLLRGGLDLYPLSRVVWLAYIVFLLYCNGTSPICNVWLGM